MVGDAAEAVSELELFFEPQPADGEVLTIMEQGDFSRIVPIQDHGIAHHRQGGPPGPPVAVPALHQHFFGTENVVFETATAERQLSPYHSSAKAGFRCALLSDVS